jgi:putative tricarboxylic transport membrane protein
MPLTIADKGVMNLKLANVISGGLFLGFSVFIFTETMKFPSLPGGIPGPALFPYILSGGMAFFSILLICSGLFSSRSVVEPSQSPEGISQDSPPAPSLSRRQGLINMALVILGMVLFVVFVNRVGFILFGFILCTGLMWRLGVAPLKAICIGSVAVMVIFWLFAKLMMVPLPLGVLGR